VDAPLEGGEVQPVVPPHDQLPVEHHVGRQERRGAGNLREEAGQQPLAAGLQHGRTVVGSEGQAAAS
jgi:hypothetical protein